MQFHIINIGSKFKFLQKSSQIKNNPEQVINMVFLFFCKDHFNSNLINVRQNRYCFRTDESSSQATGFMSINILYCQIRMDTKPVACDDVMNKCLELFTPIISSFVRRQTIFSIHQRIKTALAFFLALSWQKNLKICSSIKYQCMRYNCMSTGFRNM